MLKRFAHVRSVSARSAFTGLERLEPRRVFDGSCGTPACDELIEITRLDGGESFWVRADDPIYGNGECAAELEANTDDGGDLYAFTTRSQAEAPHADIADVAPGSDADLYDFGQDRGPEIDDEAEYETFEEASDEPAPVVPPVTDGSGAPTQDHVDAADSEQSEIPVPAEKSDEIVPIALVPTAGSIRWIGDGSVAIGDLGGGLDSVDADRPAMWKDLTDLPVTEIVVQA
jgi:hypothetical protein